MKDIRSHHHSVHWRKGAWILSAAAALMGCSKEAPTDPLHQETGQTAASAPAEPKRLEGSFYQAIRPFPPPNALPPTKTVTGKSVGKLYTQVEKEWPAVKFASAGGRKLAYRATLETDAGTVWIDLYPDAAPNHVRSFVALARAGYYDGLYFEQVIGGPAAKETNLPHLVFAGSPNGDGNDVGSIGYWLLPEIADPKTLRHEAGVIGACRGEELDTAGCRFYITLSEAPVLDGHYTIFGKVSQGLDVVRKLSERVVRSRATAVELPKIRKVTIAVEQRDDNVVRAKN